jgi:hypothetical protein
MVNEPMPWQMTVERLRELIRDVPGDVVVALHVPAPGIGDRDLDVFYDVEVEYKGGPLFRLVPRAAPPSGRT